MSAWPSRRSIHLSRFARRRPIGKVLFGYSPLVYFALIMVFAVGWFLNRTRAGLVLRAVGENDLSAHSIGYSVIGVRYAVMPSAARWRGSPAPISRW